MSARDAEAGEGRLDLLGRAPIPVGRVLELVGVEVQRARQMRLEVLLRDAEVHVEEEGPTGRRGLGTGRRRAGPGARPDARARRKRGRRSTGSASSAAHPCQPASSTRTSLAPSSLQPRGECARVARPRRRVRRRRCGRSRSRTPFSPSRLATSAGSMRGQPRGREGDGARDVPAAGLVGEAPAVEGGQRSDVDDDQARRAESRRPARRSRSRAFHVGEMVVMRGSSVPSVVWCADQQATRRRSRSPIERMNHRYRWTRSTDSSRPHEPRRAVRVEGRGLHGRHVGVGIVTAG